MNRPKFIGAEIYRKSTYGSRHPLAIPRVSTAMDLCRALGWLPPDQYLTSPRAKPKALTIWHDAGYIDALIRAERDGTVSDEVRRRHNIGTTSNPVFPEIFRRPATAAGGSFLAGELLRDAGVVYHPAGGTHHGMPDHANGFCYLNDPVLAMLSLRRSGLQRLAYVDIDAHHCDGVAGAFDGDPDVLMISIHEEGRWPFTGHLEDVAGGSAINLPVPRAFNDSEFDLIKDALVLPAIARFEPDAIVLQCGADAVTDDPLSRLELSNNAHWSMVRDLRGLSDRYLVLGGGGYNPWTVGRLWAGVWATLNDIAIPETLPTAAKAILEELSWTRRSKDAYPPAEMTSSLRDAPNRAPVRSVVEARVDHLVRRQGLTRSAQLQTV